MIPPVLDRKLLRAQGLSITEPSVLINRSEQPGRSMRMSESATVVSISVSGLTRRPRPRPTGCPHPRGIRPAGGGLPHPLAGMREHVTNHLADLDLPAFTNAMSGIATAETGPASLARPRPPSLTKLPPAPENHRAAGCPGKSALSARGHAA